MSNRYVWQKSNIDYTINEASLSPEENYQREMEYYIPTFPDNQCIIGDAYSLVNGQIAFTHQINFSGYGENEYGFKTIDREFFQEYCGHVGEGTGGRMQYRFLAKSPTNSTIAWLFVLEPMSSGGHFGSFDLCYWDYMLMIQGSVLSSADSISEGGSKYLTVAPTQGSLVGTVAGTSPSTFPQDGVSGNYWYEYQGSDDIDAEAVTYSTTSPRGGQAITINVTPSTGKTFGGTVRYTYQVQLAGGAWQTIATNSTATSCEYTIPAGTATFAARVLASDDLGFSSSDYVTGSTLTVINNEAPSAPASISIGDVLGGQNCTITWGEATDTDGTIASYQLERNVDGGDVWTQIYSGLNMSYQDMVNSEWATINYRVRAVDDDGEPGPYVTGTAKVVNDGWLFFSGPPEDMGDKPAPFTFSFAIGSTTPNVTDIDVTVTYDDTVIYTGTPDADEQINILIDTRITYAGEHVLLIEAEKASLLGLSRVCTFEVPELSLPDGGRIILYHDDNGVPVYPMTLGRAVISLGSEDANRIFDRYFSGTYTGTGTSGAGNPCRLRLSFVPRFLFVFSPTGNAWGFWIRTAEPTSAAQGTMATNGGSCTVQWDNDDLILSWYGSSAGVQLNLSGVEYGFVVTG